MAEGKCSTRTCKRPAVAGGKRCQYCRDRANKHAKKRQLLGLCGGCPARAEDGRTRCRKCHDTMNTYHRLHKPALENYRICRDVVFDFYGRTCQCCGEDQFCFLTIDHIYGRSQEELRKGQDYRNLARCIVNGNPRTDLRTLCYNCNCGRARNDGICPHEVASGGE